MSQAIRVGVYGASGYVGMELISILTTHPNVRIQFATSNTFAGATVEGTDLRYITSTEAQLSLVDAVFLALPHGASAPIAAQALQAGCKVIDLSADLRLNTPEAYEKWYKAPHPKPELLPVVYGLPEVNRGKIPNLSVVAVPGCYPTTTLLGLYPLLQISGIATDAPIIVDAKSGISGAGREPKPNTHFVEVYGNLTPYNAGRSHRHVGEIEQEIHHIVGPDYPLMLIFVPHLLPVDRGLMTSIYITLNYNITGDKVHNLYANVYGDEPLVDVLPIGEQATLKHVVRTNKCVISITPISDRYIHITSVTDNLRKGAASQAVQNFNLMFGLSEITGLL